MRTIITVNRVDKKETAKSALYNTIANLIAMVIGVVMIPIISRILSTEDMGIAVSFTTIRNICLYICTLATYSAINKGMLDYKDEKNKFLSSIFLFNIILIVFFLILSLIIERVFTAKIEISHFFFYWLFISVFFNMAKTIGVNYLLFHNKYILMAIIILLSGPISQIVSIMFINMLETNKYIGRLIGLDSFVIIIGFVVSIVILWKGKFAFKIKHVKYALAISLPLIMHLISQTILTQSDILMITHFEGSSKAGIYSMAYTIGTLLYTVLIQIMAAWSPWVYRQLEQNNIEEIYKYSKIILLIGALLATGLMTISPEIVNIFLAEEYREGAYIVAPIVMGMYFQFIYLFFYDIEYFNKKTKYIAISSLIAATVNITLNWLLIPRVGYIAAAYTTIIGYMILAILHYIYMRKIDIRKIYDIKLIIILCFVLQIFSILIVKQISHIVFRYSCFGMIIVWLLLTVYVQRDKYKIFRKD